MPKIATTLTYKAVRELSTRPGVHAVGGVVGLVLDVRPKANGRGVNSFWCLRRFSGRKPDKVGLGSYPGVSLANARNMAREILERAAASGCSLKVARDELKGAPLGAQDPLKAGRLFQSVAEQFMAERIACGYWSNADEAARAQGRLSNHILPVIGHLSVAAIKAEDIVRVLHSKSVSALRPDSARKVRALLRAVFSKAVAEGMLDKNPMNSDRLRTLMDAGRQTRPPAVDLHRGALRPEEMPEFFAELVEVIARSEEMRKSSASAKALAFAILTASRSGNVLAAEWDEFDFEAHTWTIPAWKMKMTANGAHVVYLSEQAEALAKSSASGKARRYVFASALGGIMSGQGAALRALLQRMNAERRERGLPEWIDTEQTRDTGEKTKISPHGICRATFKTWTQTATNPATGQRFIPEAAELCLHHRLTGAGGLGRAYERNDFEQERRDMAAAWARFCLSKTAPERWKIAIG